MTKNSPMMVQWHACKEGAKGALLLFRLGDFYEAFYEDAEVLARELELTLTKRQDIPMAGVPAHTCDTYIDRLVAKGYRVAIAEQTEDAKLAKGLVKREVVRIVTPGTLIHSGLLSEQTHNFFASIVAGVEGYGLAFVDLTTGTFYAVEISEREQLWNELFALKPAEILVSKRLFEKEQEMIEELQRGKSCLVNTWEEWHFDRSITERFLLEHFSVQTLDGFGLKEKEKAIQSAGALLQFVQDHLSMSTQHLQSIATYSPAEYMGIDRTTERNLELIQSLQDRSRRGTLLSVLDQTETPMGARLLKRWVQQPLLDIGQIRARQEAVSCFVERGSERKRLQDALSKVRDLERMMMRIRTGYASPRDLVGLCHSLQPVVEIRALLEPLAPRWLQERFVYIAPLPEVVDPIARAIVDAPPIKMSEGGVIREGYRRDLDELRQLQRNSKTWLVQYQNDLKEKLGIKTLKIGYTRIFGYYIEVSKGQADRMPETYHRRQTLTNAERFLSPELKEFEQKVLTAEERALAIEQKLFQEVRETILPHASRVLLLAQALAEVDALLSFAVVAVRHRYTLPTMVQDDILHIEEGRHPIIEEVASHQQFIPNDTHLNERNERIMILTGPNMAGKSTYIRQVALIVIMAQMGSFVPAQSATLGLVDQVFARIGASDDLTRGQSTFMVEMAETAHILHNATNRSLVILDEIGRGTSTYDGISIAWSVIEYLLQTEEKRAKTLFATHYWELTQLEERNQGAVNYRVDVHETDDQVIFLRKIVRGGADKSYGIHVARIAGVPLPVVERAKEILSQLEQEGATKKIEMPKNLPNRRMKKKESVVSKEIQLVLFS